MMLSTAEANGLGIAFSWLETVPICSFDARLGKKMADLFLKNRAEA
jgi:hypothetical protein